MNGHERVRRALAALTRGLQPFVEKELMRVHGERWIRVLSARTPQLKIDESGVQWDAHSLLLVTWDRWNDVFRDRLGFAERSLVSELRGFRNQWAHQETFGFDDTHRILDSVQRLLEAIGSAEATEVAREKQSLLQERFSREARDAQAKLSGHKRRRIEVAVFVTCAVALVLQLVQTFGSNAWAIALMVSIFFIYLTYKRLTLEPPLGLHECARCERIIDGIECPHCDAELDAGGRLETDGRAAKQFSRSPIR